MDLELDYPDGVIHYTTDGSDPTPKSPIYDGKPFLVDRGSEIRARGFSKKGKPLGKITIKTFLL
jgi:hexosaminidase